MTDVPTVKIIEKITALKAEVTLHKEIADAREFEAIVLEDKVDSLRSELLATKEKTAQAYQVIGALATLASCFEHPEVSRALDYFASDRFDPEFLPFASGTISADLERDGYKLVKFTVSERRPFEYDGRE